VATAGGAVNHFPAH